MEKEKYDIIIIGGGVSGLSLAYLLAEMDRKVLILEKTERTGGAIESMRYEDFSIDLGAHTAYNSYTNLLKLVEINSVQNQLKKRVKQKYFFSSPKGLQKLTKHLHFMELIFHLPKMLTNKKEKLSVEKYYSKVLGKKNYKHFARHFFKAVLCQEAGEYPASFFLKKRNGRNKSFPRSFTFSEGMQAFAQALKNNENIKIKHNVEVKDIEYKENYSITTEEETFKAEAIAFATYADEVAKLTSLIAPQLSSILTKIPYQTVSSLGIITSKDKQKHLKQFAGLLTNTDCFTSIVSRDIAPHPKYRGFTIHSQGKVARKELRNILCNELKISPETIIVEKYKNNRLPQLKRDHQDFLETLEENLIKHKNIYLTGNYFQGLSLEDCIERSQQEALRYISTP